MSHLLGKPYEPNGIIKSEIEYILLLRKPGAYRKPTPRQRELSRIAKEDYHTWYGPCGTTSAAPRRPAIRRRSLSSCRTA